MANPKLLAEVTIPTGGARLKYTSSAGASTHVASLVADADFSTVLEMMSAMQDGLRDTDLGAVVTCNAQGTVEIRSTVSGMASLWGSCTEWLTSALGYQQTETVSGGRLTASMRHVYGWYSPVLHYYAGSPRRMARRLTPTGDGNATIYGATTGHKRRRLRFQPLLEAQIDPDVAETAADGYGGSIDWTDRTLIDFWEYVNARRFRCYEDASDGSVGNAGTEGTDYYCCIREDDEIEPTLAAGEDLTWWSIELPVLIVEE